MMDLCSFMTLDITQWSCEILRTTIRRNHFSIGATPRTRFSTCRGQCVVSRKVCDLCLDNPCLLTCPIDPQPQVRLLAVTSTGDARVYTVDRRDRSSPWAANFTADTDAIPSALANLDTSIVIEAKTGFRCRADNHGLMTAMDPDGLIGGKRGDKHWLWITAGAKGARTTLDVTGDRIAKVAWPSKGGNVVEIQMVEHMDASTLVVFTDLCQAFVYSLPGLEMMHTLDLPFSGKSFVHLSSYDWRLLTSPLQDSSDLRRHYRRLHCFGSPSKRANHRQCDIWISLQPTPVVLQTPPH
jgi:hypothetical protein